MKTEERERAVFVEAARRATQEGRVEIETGSEVEAKALVRQFYAVRKELERQGHTDHALLSRVMVRAEGAKFAMRAPEDEQRILRMANALGMPLIAEKESEV